MPRASPADVRSAMSVSGDTSNHPDDELHYPLEFASSVVDLHVAPYSTGKTPLRLIEAEVAAAVYRTDPETRGSIAAEQEGQARIEYGVIDDMIGEEGWSHWNLAQKLDDTGRLGAQTGSFEVH